ncbi:hypothetical protein CB1_000832009 [Camelus ferus]|nr:hypothetical protein CB1_000832009 [Camelus ferus]
MCFWTERPEFQSWYGCSRKLFAFPLKFQFALVLCSCESRWREAGEQPDSWCRYRGAQLAPGQHAESLPGAERRDLPAPRRGCFLACTLTLMPYGNCVGKWGVFEEDGAQSKGRKAREVRIFCPRTSCSGPAGGHTLGSLPGGTPLLSSNIHFTLSDEAGGLCASRLPLFTFSTPQPGDVVSRKPPVPPMAARGSYGSQAGPSVPVSPELPVLPGQSYLSCY